MSTSLVPTFYLTTTEKFFMIILRNLRLYIHSQTIEHCHTSNLPSLWTAPVLTFGCSMQLQWTAVLFL